MLYCTHKDKDGDEFVQAYGCTHMPIQPGSHKKTVRMFSPIEKNKCAEFFGFYWPSRGMVVDNTELIAKAYGREIARVAGGGKVTISVNLTERNMEKHGYVSTVVRK